MPNPLVVIAPA